MVQKYSTPVVDHINEKLCGIEPKDYIPVQNRDVLYKGPAIFRCAPKLVNELYKHFGLPSCNSKQNDQKKITYSVQEAEITFETLCWLSKEGITIEGPEELSYQIRDYQADLSKLLEEY